MHLITIRDQVCNVMASLTKTFLSVPNGSLKITTVADYHSCCMPFSMVGSTGTVLQHDKSAPCKRAQPQVGPTVRASAPCKREVSLDRLLEVAQLEVVVRMLSDRIQELVIQPCESSEAGTVSSPHRWGTLPGQGSPMDLLVQGPKLLDSLLTLFFTHLWWLWWLPWCSSPGNS